ncbi:MAG TPA: glycosyltransferase [Bryobacteraceae bacterium]|nr:glycosyltransferase [Bryobacteraceae bacterium]
MAGGAAWLLAALAVGSGVYCVLVLFAVWDFRRPRRHRAGNPPLLPLSVLKPLSGLDEGLEGNLRSFFEQDYPSFELLFAIRSEADPAATVVRSLIAEYSHVPASLLIVGEPPWENAKVWSLHQMTSRAQSEVLVMSDSDIRVTPGFLAAVASEFQDPKLGVSSCLYRAVAGRSLPSTLEAVGMNTEFLSGVLVARVVEGVKFALGPTLTARRKAIADVGGWAELAGFLAEDFVLGNRAANRGWRVILSDAVVEHRIGSQPWRANAGHRLRWFRSTRRSRPSGYVGQLFTNPLPLVLLAWAAVPEWWLVYAVVLALRGAAAVATAGFVVQDWKTLRRPWLIVIQDLLSFAFWIAGFFGNTVRWRGQSYELLSDGRFRRAD